MRLDRYLILPRQVECFEINEMNLRLSELQIVSFLDRFRQLPLGIAGGRQAYFLKDHESVALALKLLIFALGPSNCGVRVAAIMEIWMFVWKNPVTELQKA